MPQKHDVHLLMAFVISVNEAKSAHQFAFLLAIFVKAKILGIMLLVQ